MGGGYYDLMHARLIQFDFELVRISEMSKYEYTQTQHRYGFINETAHTSTFIYN